MINADMACTDSDCVGIMHYDSGVTFTCDACKREWAPSWIVIDALDRLLCDLSLTDGPAIETVMRIALNEQRITGDPDNYPDLSDIPAMLGNLDLDTRVIVAWAAWRRDREMVADQVA